MQSDFAREDGTLQQADLGLAHVRLLVSVVHSARC